MASQMLWLKQINLLWSALSLLIIRIGLNKVKLACGLMSLDFCLFMLNNTVLKWWLQYYDIMLVRLSNIWIIFLGSIGLTDIQTKLLEVPICHSVQIRRINIPGTAFYLFCSLKQLIIPCSWGPPKRGLMYTLVILLLIVAWLQWFKSKNTSCIHFYVVFDN